MIGVRVRVYGSQHHAVPAIGGGCAGNYAGGHARGGVLNEVAQAFWATCVYLRGRNVGMAQEQANRRSAPWFSKWVAKVAQGVGKGAYGCRRIVHIFHN